MRKGDTSTFDAEVHEKTVRVMRERHESVSRPAEETYKKTGRLDPNVSVYKTKQGSVRRVSRNAFVKNDDGTCTLKLGIKIPIIDCGDATHSFWEYLAPNFESMKNLFGTLNKLQSRYQIDLSVAISQDVCDDHDVFQMSQFESGNIVAEHVRQLFPDDDGGDFTEDYDLALAYVNMGVDTDIVQYGLKGYFIFTADADGRGSVSQRDMEKYFGFQIQGNQSTKSICKSLLKKWHLYLIQVHNHDSCANWWSDMIGRDRIVHIDDGRLLSSIKAGIIYVTETLQPDRDGLKNFLMDGTNESVSSYDIDRVWEWLQSIKPHFGEQARLPGYNEIPKPGDIFAHYRDPWPIGHRRAGENPSAGGSPTPAVTDSPTPTKDDIPWGNL